MITRRNFLKNTAGLSALCLAGQKLMTPAHASSSWYVPEEALPHTRTFMQWPVNRQVHPDPVFLDMLQNTIADIANVIAQFEPVVMLMDKSHQTSARRKLSEDVEIWDMPTDDLWARDSGPMFVIDDDGGLAVSSVNFNGWGNKQPHQNDGKVAQRIAEILDIPYLNNGLVGEAGGVDCNGDGILIAHESSWINPNRNRGSKAEVTRLMQEAFGVDKVIWAPGIWGEDITDYHIDALARFTGPNDILIQLPEPNDMDDIWVRAAYKTYDILKAATNLDGAPFNLLTLPGPRHVRSEEEEFVDSYVNYYVCNDAVIAAQFGDRETDLLAKETLQLSYPDREVILLDIDPVAEVGGGIHCATQQQPLV
ncbi:agmatine deiminase family protein [Terasakiella sp. A23]|uniref:agmatine deiminase family protein n=1 Tax=Terasakiella sp. FCG-A23 TaxID=3080561 RepID=UPI0029558856|nr:agmatine deiminase family protein [Terasakiella sp. A23]MDV7339416.1 agmatine deiminase family protein [Terasakiella sp. A23]